MRKTSARLGVLFLLTGTAYFVLALFRFTELQKHFALTEAYYRPPVFLNGSVIRIRQDAYGKGHFGASRDGGRYHQGIDISAPVGKPILAAKSGRVVFAGQGKGYGLYVRIAHPDGLSTLYAHLSSIYVKTGDWVVSEEFIGTCGKSGNASNPRMKPHLHFEIQTPSGVLDPNGSLFGPSVKIKRS